MLGRILVIMIAAILMFMVQKPDKIEVNINNIRVTSEYDTKFRLRPSAGDFTVDGYQLFIPEIQLAGKNMDCIAERQVSIANAYADVLAKPIARIQYYQEDYEACPDRLGKTMFTVLVSSSPMAGYPEYPMQKDTEDMILEGLTSYRVYHRPAHLWGRESHKVLFANFQLDDLYVFVQSEAFVKVTESAYENFVLNLDQVYTALLNK